VGDHLIFFVVSYPRVFFVQIFPFFFLISDFQAVVAHFKSVKDFFQTSRAGFFQPPSPLRHGDAVNQKEEGIEESVIIVL
jgi:hypothetical protein